MAVSVPSFNDLLNHPYSFAVGIGVTNGLLAKARNKHIDPMTAVTLSLILGLGEAALVAREPTWQRKQSLTAIAVYSVLGVLTGVWPFVRPESEIEAELEASQGPMIRIPLIANVDQPKPNGERTAVSGYSRGRRSRGRRA